MEFRDLKYLLAYVLPIATFYSIYLGGMYSFLTVIVAFGAIPILEIFTAENKRNLSDDEVKNKNNSAFFDALLYGNVIWIYALIILFCFKVSLGGLAGFELLGMTFSLGVLLGSNGINVAHELGHKEGFLPQIAAALLLLPNLYMHFTMEHNLGHHLKVGTPEDPATSRLGENIFLFWWRSITQSWLSAWKLEAKRLTKSRKKVISLSNKMFVYLGIQFTYIWAVSWFFTPFVGLLIFIAGLTGILLLESINYIEHYGLVRRILDNGRYERVETFHSWNSDHEIGRILLYELTRHSDHHYKANKKYQVLNHYDESPQLPFGYPTSILIALVPPLWFRLMNPKVIQWRQTYLEQN